MLADAGDGNQSDGQENKLRVLEHGQVRAQAGEREKYRHEKRYHQAA
jgi:hypothetical protein